MVKMTLKDLEASLLLGGWKIDIRGEGETFWMSTENGAYIRVGPAYTRDTQGRGRVGTYTYSINAKSLDVFSYEGFYWHAFGAMWNRDD